MSALNAEGFKTPRTLQIGKLQRLDGADDKHGKKSAWYIYNELEDNQNSGSIIGVASYGDWKLNITQSWCSRSEHRMNITERNNYNAAREAMRSQYEEETRIKQAEAAKTAYIIWSEAKKATEHTYLTNKGVGASEGLKIGNDGRLIIPITIDEQITSLQFINNKSEKRFLTGGKLKGGWFLIEGETDVVYIAEGYSTARSVYEATGKTVYIAFNASNIYEVSSYAKNKHRKSRIIIAGDDDTETKRNTGRLNAEQTADGLGLEVIFPIGFNDFNDMHHAQGTKALKKYLCAEKLEVYEIDKTNETGLIDRPNGILGDIFDYYNTTSGNNQKGFAIQTALGICSIILGRSYKTSLENFTPLYLLNVAKSGTGKEHAKTVVEKILYQVNLDHLIAGDGYTSAGAVFSTLLDRPKHISVIDEFGRYLEAGRDMGKGNQHQREANTKLMEAISRSHSIMRPPSYSSMTLKKDAADAIKNRLVHNPAITLLTMTTPNTLFKSLDMGAIKDGFFNRFIVSISDTKRSIRHHKQPIGVPNKIIMWANDVMARADQIHTASEPASPVTLEFSNEAYEMQLVFQQYANVDLPNSLEKYGMAELSGRANEMAMKISLICALSRDPHTTIIEAQDMEWAIYYVKQSLEKTVERLKITLSHSGFEANKKELLADLRERSSNGITWAKMQKTPPYSQYKPKDLKDILQSLKDADLAGEEPYSNGRGRPTVKWIALK